MDTDRDIRYYLRIFYLRRNYFIWPFLAVFLTVALVAMLMPSIYESSSTILIEEQQIPPDFVRSTVTGYADERIQSLTQQILSRIKLLEIIKQFRLYPEMRKKYTQEEIIGSMRRNIKIDTISAEVAGQKRRGPQTAVTIAFSVSYRGKNPETVQKVAGTLASLYLEQNLKIREEQARSTTRFLEAELKELKERIQTIGTKISTFKKEHEGILPELQQFNLSQSERLDNDIKQLDSKIRATQDRKIILEGQLATVQPDFPGSPAQGATDPHIRLRHLRVVMAELQSKFSVSHPDVQKVRREISELEKLVGKSGAGVSLRSEKLTQFRTELAQKQGRYADNHPEVRKLKKAIAELEKSPEPGAAPTRLTDVQNPAYVHLLTSIHSADNDLQSLAMQKAHLQEKLMLFRQRIEDAPKVEQEYLALMRDYQNAHTKHQEIMNKLLEARISEGMEEHQKAEKFTLIDPASYPEKPVSPKRKIIFLAGLIISLMSGLVGVAIIEHLDHSVKSADELAWLTGLPVLGKIAIIETVEDVKKKIYQRRLIWSTVGCSLIAGLVIFHFFYMDLWVLTAKLRRLAGKYI